MYLTRLRCIGCHQGFRLQFKILSSMAAAVQNPVSSMDSSTATTEAERASDFIALNIASLVDKDKKSNRKKEPVEGNSFNVVVGPRNINRRRRRRRRSIQ